MRFNHLNIENGLSQSTIKDILQDSKGFLWFATEDGLNKYDGYEFTVYKNRTGDHASISTNSVTTLLEDSRGYIWVATWGGGLNRFDRKTEKFKRYQFRKNDPTSLSSNYVTALFEDRSGVILVGTQKGLNIYEPGKDSFFHYKTEAGSDNTLEGKWITSIIEDHRGILWIGTQKNGLSSFDRETGELTHYPQSGTDVSSRKRNWIVTIYEDRENVLWVGTQRGGLSRFDRETGNFTWYERQAGDSQSLSHNWVLTLFEDQFGELWVGTLNGLNIFDRKNDRFINISQVKDAPDLNNKSITALYEDKSGVFWVGTKDDALYKFVRSTEYFTVYNTDSGKLLRLSDNNVWAVQEDMGGSLWIGTQGGGVNKIDPARKKITYYANVPGDSTSLSDDFVHSIYQDRDSTVWIGTIDGVNKYVPEIDGFRHFKHDPDNPNTPGGNIITTINQDKTGKIWFGTLNNGLSQYDKASGTFTNYKSEAGNNESLSHNKIWSFYEDRNGAFWVGTHGFGLNKYDRVNDVFGRYVHELSDSSSISNNFINFIYQDSSGRYWIGTLDGLNEFHPETESFTRYAVKDGLPNNVVYGIMEDERGHLWLSTNKGISDFDPVAKKFRNYDVGDGLPSDEFRFGAYDRGGSGTMYFGGINGLVAFEADSIRDNPHIPPVVLTRFEIDNRPVKIDSASLLTSAISETKQLNLSYDHQVFSFEFAALHYAAPLQNQYAYKMEGYDDVWQYIGNRRFVSFTNMPSGSYTFRVKAANKDGIWNEAGTALKISIAPPPWLSWWAFACYGLAGTCMLFGFVQYRIGLERKKKRRLEEQNEHLEVLVGERTTELKQEKEKSDRLLYNILPEEVAEELKEMGTTSPRKFEEATILFTDFQGFSTTSARIPADRLVGELNEIFQRFDEIIENNGLEKIKTIGDAYMAAGGLPSYTKNHASECVDAACEMLAYLEERNQHAAIKWEMRVGIHSGSVVAGVVGRRKFTYDLWGDTVILASRMESCGKTGKINISASTHELIKKHYYCEYRGKINAEGRGMVDMYFVSERIKDTRIEFRIFEN